MSEEGTPLAVESAGLVVSRPRPLWSEQDPEHWWQATMSTLLALRQRGMLSGLRAIGLTGQMHGATFIDAGAKVLRPAILWNDGRAVAECRQLEAATEATKITGNRIMPGFTAPKALWVKQHEPEVFRQTRKILLPKDYLRYRLTGEFATDTSDAAGTMWLDVATRDWSDAMLAACDMDRDMMPTVHEGPGVSGVLRTEIAAQLGCAQVPVVAGAGDNAAGALGVGITSPGQAMLSLGTSGVYFAVSPGFRANPEQAVHAFCHALPDTWHLMSVTLSAAVCLDWLDKLTGAVGIERLLQEAADGSSNNYSVIFLPYLSGERTPHDDPNATGVFFGLTHNTGRPDLTRAVLQGVSLALWDGVEALHHTGLVPDEITLIGGGARSRLWRQILADTIGRPLHYRQGGEVGPAQGAAYLARLGCNANLSYADAFPLPALVETHEPNAEVQQGLTRCKSRFRELYVRLRTLGTT